MARPLKEGIDYFPLDTVMDTKVALIEAQFGLQGFAVYIKLLQYIYGEHGYYARWSDDVTLLFARRVGESAEVVERIVTAAVDRGLFDADLFALHGILTSRGIQKRYREATKKRKDADIDPRYDLLQQAEAVSGDDNAVSSGNNAVNDDHKPTKKNKQKQTERESKKKHMKTNETKNAADAEACALFADYWNNHVATAGPPRVKEPAKWSQARRRALSARVREEGAQGVLDVFDKVRASDFLTGKGGGWQASFDWVIGASNFEKIAEGNYANTKQQAAPMSFYDKVILADSMNQQGEDVYEII